MENATNRESRHQKVPNRPNASTARTRARIHEAFLSLAESVDFANITVNMLTRQAELNRTTFYLHYSTISDLEESIVSELLDELFEGSRQIEQGIGIDHPEWHETYYRKIGQRPVLFHRLLSLPGSSPLGSRLIERHLVFIRHYWHQLGYEVEKSPEIWNLRARFAAAGLYGATQQWLEDGMREPPESVCKRSLEMIQLMSQAELTPANGD